MQLWESWESDDVNGCNANSSRSLWPVVPRPCCPGVKPSARTAFGPSLCTWPPRGFPAGVAALTRPPGSCPARSGPLSLTGPSLVRTHRVLGCLAHPTEPTSSSPCAPSQTGAGGRGLGGGPERHLLTTRKLKNSCSPSLRGQPATRAPNASPSFAALTLPPGAPPRCPRTLHCPEVHPTHTPA